MMKMVRIVVMLIASALLFSAAQSAEAQEAYTLGPEDVIEVSVYGYPDLTRVVTVLPDGTIALPLIGIVRAAGLTMEELTDTLISEYKLYIRNPRVAVIVTEFRKISVSVIGQVTRPGTYDLRPGSTVLDALSAAGGLTETASVTAARLVRRNGATLPLPLEALLLRQDMSKNVLLEPWDTVMIPEETNNRIFVLGDVNAPGAFVLKGDLTLLQALALAGGPAQRGFGTARNVHIIRRAGTTPTVPEGTKVERLQGQGNLITVDLPALMRNGGAGRDVVVVAGDIIVVPQSGLSGMQTILSILGGLTTVFR